MHTNAICCTISLAPLSEGAEKHRQVLDFLRDLLQKKHSQLGPFFSQLPSQSRRIESPVPPMGRRAMKTGTGSPESIEVVLMKCYSLI